MVGRRLAASALNVFRDGARVTATGVQRDVLIVLAKIDKRRLRRMLNAAPPRKSRRAEVVLLAAEGMKIEQVMARTGQSRTFVARWLCRFADEGFSALLRNRRLTLPRTLSDRCNSMVVSSMRPGSARSQRRSGFLSRLGKLRNELTIVSERLKKAEARSDETFDLLFDSARCSAVTLVPEEGINGLAAHVACGLSKSRLTS